MRQGGTPQYHPFSYRLAFGIALSLLMALMSLPGQRFVEAQVDKTILAKALQDHSCDATEWHFVINQLDSAAQAPQSIQVKWANGQTQSVALDKVTGGVAHYSTTANLNSAVVEARASIDESWGGNFNLSHGPCIAVEAGATADKDKDKEGDDKQVCSGVNADKNNDKDRKGDDDEVCKDVEADKDNDKNTDKDKEGDDKEVCASVQAGKDSDKDKNGSGDENCADVEVAKDSGKVKEGGSNKDCAGAEVNKDTDKDKKGSGDEVCVSVGADKENDEDKAKDQTSVRKSIEKKVVSVAGVATANDGRGRNSAPAKRGQDVTYQIVVTGTPPGQSGKKGEVVDNVPQNFHFMSAEPAAGYDGNKATWSNVEFKDEGPVTLRITLRVGAVAPCNHVATNVAHVNGIGSDQAQVWVLCEETGVSNTPAQPSLVAAPPSPQQPSIVAGVTTAPQPPEITAGSATAPQPPAIVAGATTAPQPPASVAGGPTEVQAPSMVAGEMTGPAPGAPFMAAPTAPQPTLAAAAEQRPTSPASSPATLPSAGGPSIPVGLLILGGMVLTGFGLRLRQR